MDTNIKAYFEELREEPSFCTHPHVIAIPEYRSMICQDCGCEVNPFDFVMSHYQDFTNLVTGDVTL